MGVVKTAEALLVAEEVRPSRALLMASARAELSASRRQEEAALGSGGGALLPLPSAFLVGVRFIRAGGMRCA